MRVEFTDDAGHAESVTSAATEPVAPRPNSPAAGAPAVGGTPQVGEELSASTSGITDADGLENAAFTYQWVRGSTDIAGAAASTYTAAAADEGERLKVRVGFTDDRGHAESVTSAATGPVAPRPEPLTASFDEVPAEHGGPGTTFTFELAFSEELAPDFSYRTLRDRAFEASGGAVRRTKRQRRGSNLRWTVTVGPSGRGPVSVRLSAPAACGVSGTSICTADGRPLSHAVSATVAGPAGLSAADARAEENVDDTLDFTVWLDRAAAGPVTVGYATEDGTATAGADYTAANGTLTFQAGERTKTVAVTLLDDTHDEGEERFTLRLSNASGAVIVDGEATGTIENHDPMPRALLARFGRTASLDVRVRMLVIIRPRTSASGAYRCL